MIIQAMLVLVLLFARPALLLTNYSGILFICPPIKTGKNPKTVHKLRPSNIKVVGAMGDSLTAGFGVLSSAETIRDSLVEYRGFSWSGGGDYDLRFVTTLPNILRQYNPNLFGYSVGITSSKNSIDDVNTRLNVAETGAFTRQLLRQAKQLVQKIKDSKMVNYKNDWKLVTVYIGHNDICILACQNTSVSDPAVWIENIIVALDYLQDNLPRTFVNLVQFINLGNVQDEALKIQIRCKDSYIIDCNCASVNILCVRRNFYKYIRSYQQNLENLMSSGRYIKSDTFTVVLQPFLSSTTIRQPYQISLNTPFVSDCRHLNPVGNRDLALGLWNNMFERVGNKTKALQLPLSKVKCPTDKQPYIFTAKNSIATQTRGSAHPFILLFSIFAASFHFVIHI